jgi:hypothetical protein
MYSKRTNRRSNISNMVGGIFCDNEYTSECPNYRLYEKFKIYKRYKDYFNYFLENEPAIYKKMYESYEHITDFSLFKCGEPIGLAGGFKNVKV